MAEKRFIVSVCRKWNYTVEERHVPYIYSVMAETPKKAALTVFQDHKNVNLHTDAYGEVMVVEAKAGRLDDYYHFYEVTNLIK